MAAEMAAAMHAMRLGRELRQEGYAPSFGVGKREAEVRVLPIAHSGSQRPSVRRAGPAVARPS